MSYYEVFYPESVYSRGALLEISSKIIHSFFLNKKCCFFRTREFTPVLVPERDFHAGTNIHSGFM